MTMEKDKRIGIVGGGIAGLYTAWRILKDGDQSSQVEIFEANETFGGRIKSQTIPGLPFRAELGAMRFRSNHLLLKSLLDEFLIPVRDFDVKFPKLRVRGRSLSLQEITDGGCSHCNASMPYLLRIEERGKSPELLVMSVIRDLLKNLNFPDLRHAEGNRVKQKIAEGDFSPLLWQIIKESGQYENTPLYSIGFWNLLQHSLSNEAVQLIHDALSLESILGNWSAAEAIPWFISDFSSPELFMVPGGMQSIVEALESRIKNFGDRVKMHTNAPVVECRRDTTWCITYKNDLGADEQKTFDSVVLALPQSPLQKIRITDQQSGGWSPKWLDWVYPHRLFKLFLLYENEWWMGDDAPGHAVGRIFTDLPLRQVYYFSPKWMQKCGKEADRGLQPHFKSETESWSLVMASYSDEHHVSFWLPPLSPEELGIQEESSRLYYKSPTNVSHASAREMERVFEQAIPDNLRAYERTVRKVQQQLKEIHGHNVPDPIIGVFKDWGEPPFGAGWHTWKVGAKPWNGKRYGTDDSQMLPNLHLCGEAYSSEQGWIEGALKTSEAVLLDQLKISEPHWERARKVEDLRSYIYT